MAKLIAIVLIVALLAGCAQTKTICGVTYDSYGLLSSEDKKNPDIHYELVVGNLVWAVLLMETIVMPIYFFGFSVFQPVGLKPPIKGAIASVPPQCPKIVEVKP